MTNAGPIRSSLLAVLIALGAVLGVEPKAGHGVIGGAAQGMPEPASLGTGRSAGSTSSAAAGAF